MIRTCKGSARGVGWFWARGDSIEMVEMVEMGPAAVGAEGRLGFMV